MAGIQFQWLPVRTCIWMQIWKTFPEKIHFNTNSKTFPNNFIPNSDFKTFVHIKNVSEYLQKVSLQKNAIFYNFIQLLSYRKIHLNSCQIFLYGKYKLKNYIPKRRVICLRKRPLIQTSKGSLYVKCVCSKFQWLFYKKCA